MGRLSIETRTRVITLWRAKFPVKATIDRLEEEGILVSRTAIFNLIVKFKKTHCVADIKRAPRSSKLNEEHYRFVDELTADTSDSMSRQQFIAFKEAFPTVDVCISILLSEHDSTSDGTQNEPGAVR